MKSAAPAARPSNASPRPSSSKRHNQPGAPPAWRTCFVRHLESGRSRFENPAESPPARLGVVPLYRSFIASEATFASGERR
jgi:hypothetical protein